MWWKALCFCLHFHIFISGWHNDKGHSDSAMSDPELSYEKGGKIGKQKFDLWSWKAKSIRKVHLVFLYRVRLFLLHVSQVIKLSLFFLVKNLKNMNFRLLGEPGSGLRHHRPPKENPAALHLKLSYHNLEKNVPIWKICLNHFISLLSDS